LSARRARIAQLVTAKSAAAKRRVAAAAQEETDGDFAMSFPRKRESRGDGRNGRQVWIPAFAGMTLAATPLDCALL
jgi:hypothetical protein